MNRTPALVVLFLLAGCSGGGASPRTPADATTPSASAPAVVDTSEPARSSAPLPSLATELRAQGSRQASALEARIGIRPEELTATTGPAWWAAAANDRNRFTGTGAGKDFTSAYEQAVTRAGAAASISTTDGGPGLDPRTLSPERVAWTRLVTGEYSVWAVMVPPGVARVVAAAPPPAVPLTPQMSVPTASPTSTPTTTPAPTASTPAAQTSVAATPPPAPPETDPTADPLAPAWWRADPIAAGGRMTIGARAEGENGKIASKAAVAEARRSLAAALGSDAKDVITLRSVTIDLPDGRARAYVLVSGRR